MLIEWSANEYRPVGPPESCGVIFSDTSNDRRLALSQNLQNRKPILEEWQWENHAKKKLIMNIGKSSFTIKRRPCHSSVPHSHHNVMVGAKELVQMSQGNEQLPRIPRTRCPGRLNQLPTKCSKPTKKVWSKQSCIPWLTILRGCSWAGTRKTRHGR